MNPKQNKCKENSEKFIQVDIKFCHVLITQTDW